MKHVLRINYTLYKLFGGKRTFLKNLDENKNWLDEVIGREHCSAQMDQSLPGLTWTETTKKHQH